MSYVDLAWPWGLVTLGLQPLLSPDQDQVEPCEGPCGDQHCQQIVFFGYLSRMTSFHHNSKMLILAYSSKMKIRVGLIGGPWLQQLTPLQDSGLNVPHSESLMFRGISESDAGTYQCVANNGFGQPAMDSIDIRVKREHYLWNSLYLTLFMKHPVLRWFV